jgi:hypothetical protein
LEGIDHERDRLIALVDRFLESVRNDPTGLTNARVEEAVIACAMGGIDSDGDEAEESRAISESKSAFKRIGVLQAAMISEQTRSVQNALLGS